MAESTIPLDRELLTARARGLLLLLLLAYLGVAARLMQLQYVKHAGYNRTRHRLVTARTRHQPWRGGIVDRQGRSLAVSVPVHSCALDPLRMREAGQDLADVLPVLEAHLGLSPRERQRLHERCAREGSRFVWVRRHLSSNVYERLREAVRHHGLAGALFPKEYQRIYPQKRLAAHVLGTSDIDGRGTGGLELVGDSLMRGRPAIRPAQRDARGRLLLSHAPPPDAERRGRGLELTLDSTIQMIAEEELAKAVERYRGPATTGCAIVMDPYTGDVLALANWPTFDPNAPTAVPADHRLNRAVAAVIEPGSVFKPFTMAAALGEGCVRVSDKFYCERGAWRMPGGRVLHDAHGYGWLTAGRIIVKSSNIGIAKVAARVGRQRLHDTLRAFGFGAPTGSGLPGELGGMLRPVREWTSYSMGSVPMGQEVAVTPLQLATAYCVFANGGVLMRPRVVRALRDGTGRPVQPCAPRPQRQVISREIATQIRRLLGQVVAEGTGRRARMPEYALGGKTGTSQLPVNAAEYRAGLRGYSEDRYVASFMGIAPWDVPRIVVLVSVREPRGAHYGGVVAAPAVREIARRALLYLRVPPENP